MKRSMLCIQGWAVISYKGEIASHPLSDEWASVMNLKTMLIFPSRKMARLASVGELGERVVKVLITG